MATHSTSYISKYPSPSTYRSSYSSTYTSDYLDKYKTSCKIFSGYQPSTMSVGRQYNPYGISYTHTPSYTRALPKTPPNLLSRCNYGRSTSVQREPLSRQPLKGVHSTSMHRESHYGDSSTSSYTKSITNSMSDMQLSDHQKSVNSLPSIHGDRNSNNSLHGETDCTRSRRQSSPVSHRRSASLDRARDKTVERSRPSDRTSTTDRASNIDRTYKVYMTPDRHSNILSHSVTSGLVGLSNLGNTCFMNSVLQCLSNTQGLSDYCLNNYSRDINTSTSTMKGALFKAYAALISKMWTGGSNSVSPSEFKSQIQQFAPRFVGYRQQDSQEFLLYLLEGLHEDVNRVTKKVKVFTNDDSDEEIVSSSEKAQLMWQRYIDRDNSKIVDLFVGQLKSALCCSTCDYTSNTFDPMWNLSLPIKKKSYGEMSLMECFDMFTQEEVMDDYEKPFCARCKERRKCTKRFTIQRFPQILILSLKRFDHGSFRSKLTTSVNFPLENLDLKHYSSQHNSKPILYDLYAVSVHSGTTYSGHYTAYCKHSDTGEWHYYNDGSVCKVSTTRVKGAEAYVLFYQRSTTANPRL